jgi:hypothetical protein
MSEGAIDNKFSDAEKSPRDVLVDALSEFKTEPEVGGIALDMVTRQPLYIRSIKAHDLVEYYEGEEFDLLTYGVHPYLPVSLGDTVYECVYLSELTVEKLSSVRDARTYDFPRGRLATVPVWGDDDE